MTKIAGFKFTFMRTAEIAEKCRIANDDFTVFHGKINMRQNPTDCARPVLPRRIQRHHRGTFRKPVAFINRQAQRPRLRYKLRRNP